MKKKLVVFNLGSKQLSYLISAIGFGIYLLSFVIGSDSESEFLLVIKHVLETIGPTVMSVGCVSLILEISTIKNCVGDAIGEIVQGDFPLDSYSDDKIENMRKKAVESKCKNRLKFAEIQDTAYFFEPYLFDLINGAYYESHKCKYILVPDDTKIKKKVYYHAVLINRFFCDNQLNFGWALKSGDNINLVENTQNEVVVKNFKINGTDYTSKAKDKFNTSKIQNMYEKYPYRVSLNWDLSKIPRAEIDFSYEYSVEKDDMVQTFKLEKPCKKFAHEIYIEGPKLNEWGLFVNAFTSLYINKSPLKDCYNAEAMTNTACKVTFDEWVLPGAGYVVSFVKR